MEVTDKQWTVRERTWCVERRLRGDKLKDIQEEFLHFFRKEKAPCKQRIHAWLKKFHEYGSVENLNKKSAKRETHSGRKKVRTSAILEQVRQDVQSSPKRSTRKRAQSLQLSQTTLRRILKEDLKMFPYHIQTKHLLTGDDKQRRLFMANILMEKIEAHAAFLPNLITTDEAHFHLDGQVNSKNNIFWGKKPPEEVAQRPLHSEKVTVWCAVWSKGILGPYFFEEEGRTASVNAERYVGVLEKFYQDLQNHYPGSIPKIWIQQDGATPHTSVIAREWLKAHFKRRIISFSRGEPFPIEWAPHSPDLSPPDYFLWGFLKDKVYADKPRTIAELKKKIEEECNAISSITCKKVMNNFCARLKKCKDQRGGHLEQML